MLELFFISWMIVDSAILIGARHTPINAPMGRQVIFDLFSLKMRPKYVSLISEFKQKKSIFPHAVLGYRQFRNTV